jgi:lipopolysaccharide export LptBFGC system permease protein LptF
MRAEFLSVPELRDYLHFNSDFPRNLLAPFVTHLHYRVALPWTCLIVVFIAAPLAIGFTRGGVLSNVAAAIGLVFANNFLMHFFLALGEGNRIPPVIAAWTPNVLFAIVGGLLLWVRSTNRDLKSLNPFAARKVSAS